MALLLPVHSKEPQIGDNCFLAPNATIVGDVIMGNYCSIWFNAVLRGDVNSIRLGNKVNIQDNAVVHCTYQKWATNIGNNVSVGHSAIVHGCTIHDDVLVGMGAIIMDGCVVHSHCIVAAGAVMLQHTVTEAGGIYAGVPAKRIKEVSEELISSEIRRVAENYTLYSDWYKKI